MWKFIRHEWKYWFSSPMTWIFLLINSMLVMGAVSSDNINIGGGVGSVHKNAPYVIETFYGTMSLICLLMTTAFMNAAANRDFESGMYQFVFSSPIKKRDYYFGKFIGAGTIAILPLLGVSIGALIGPLMPWAQPERYGPVVWSGHLQGLIVFGIPNTLITAVFMYVLGILFRSNIVSFVGSMVILIMYALSSNFTRDIEKEWLANVLDPFGFRPEGIVAKYMTVDEKNLHGVPLMGPLLWNRLLWMGISFVILLSCYFRFSFSLRTKKAKKNKEEQKEAALVVSTTEYQPSAANRFSARGLWYLVRFETKAIIKNPTFIIIVTIGLLNLVASLTTFTGRYGIAQYPVTYDVIDRIKGSFYIFMVGIITFYSGVLVWKERDAKIAEIQDATPVQNAMLFLSKLIAMVIALGIVQCATIVIGMITQAAHGYYRFQPEVYIESLLLMDLVTFSFLVVAALFFHYIINNRYLAYFAFVAFVIVNQFIWGVFHVSTNMVKFGCTPNTTYSDMNGFGPFVPSTIWYTVYWILASVLICFVVYAFYVRGKELGFGQRVQHAKLALGRHKMALLICVVAFVACSGFVFYNTKVLNKYDSDKEQEDGQVAYEQKYKQYEHIAKPRFTKHEYHISIMPEQRSMTADVYSEIKNKTDQPISEIHFSIPQIPDTLNISIPGAKLTVNDKKLYYRIYKLDKPMMPGESLSVTFHASRYTRGFENEVSFTQLTQNGTFFNNKDILPSIGYQADNELSDKNKRIKYKLPKRIRMPRLNEADIATRMNNYIGNDADWVSVNTTISTSPDQMALAPGSLVKTWDSAGRKYFHYTLEKNSFDFYSFISARYQVQRKKWNGIDLEVYYDKAHEYNVPNMMKSLEKSLEYYTTNFGPYYHKQCRIIEFPRYASFAQSFPGTMPYSEGIGFIIDLRKVTVEDIDEVYYVVAHEMGHQYWAHQLCGANMQGSEMMSEGFAQYSALMVMEKEYGKDKMKKFLKYEMDGYLRGRSSEFEAERPMIQTEHQQYIHYQKASVVMYYLKEMIGEDKVNLALHSLLDSFAYKEPPYAVSLAADRAFRRVTPDSLQYLVDDMFEHITLFSNRLVDAKAVKSGSDYVVTLHTTSEKFRADSLGKETAMPVNDYVDIGVFAEPGANQKMGKPLAMQRVKITGKENTYTFHVAQKPYQAGIDPYNYLIDRIPDDNVKKVEN